MPVSPGGPVTEAEVRAFLSRFHPEIIAAVEAEAVTDALSALKAEVEGLRVRATKRDETPWQEGFRQSRNETVAAVLAAIDGWTLVPKEAPMASEPMTQADRAIAAEAVLDAIRREYTRARTKHAPLNSGHEAVGVIDEEFVEFKDAVYFGVDRHGRRANPMHEAIQVAAMALAYVVEAYQTWEFAGGSDE